MDIEQREVTVGELTKGYHDDHEGGVSGYGGRLNIRPAYQREFVYTGKQRDAVINTAIRGLPLNVMYWSKRDDDGDYEFEMIDGQQRTISLAQYVDNVFSHNDRFFHSLTAEEQQALLDYKLTIFICSGPEKERLEWFETINTAGERLTPQELLNAVYGGPWVSDARGDFSRTGCRAARIADKYVNGSPIRQDFLEKALQWSAAAAGVDVPEYMSKHQHDKSAQPLWSEFRTVIDWVEATFPNYRRSMKGIDWGALYREHGARDLDAEALEAEIAALIQDDDVTSERGIYAYTLTRDPRHLNIRAFDNRTKQATYERQGGKCVQCGGAGKIGDMDADHITPWIEGGRTEVSNCQILCKPCNRSKGAK